MSSDMNSESSSESEAGGGWAYADSVDPGHNKKPSKKQKHRILVAALANWDLTVAAPCHPLDPKESKAMWRRVRATMYRVAADFEVKRTTAAKLYTGNYKATSPSDIWTAAMKTAVANQQKEAAGEGAAAADNTTTTTAAGPAASKLPPGAIATHNAAVTKGSALEKLKANQAAADSRSAARKAAMAAVASSTSAEVADKAVIRHYLNTLTHGSAGLSGGLISQAQCAAWKLAEDRAAVSGCSKHDVFEHPFPTGWILPADPAITNPTFTPELRREEAIPWVRNFDVGAYNRQPRVLPCCDRCGRNCRSLDDGSIRRVHKKCMEWKMVVDLGRRYAVVYCRYKCSALDCPGVIEVREKYNAAQAKLPAADRKVKTEPHEHVFSIMNHGTFAQLPTDLQNRFPAVVRNDMIPDELMSKDLAALLVGTVSESNGLSPNRMSDALAEVRGEAHGRLAHAYYGRALDELQHIKLLEEQYKGPSPFGITAPDVIKFGEESEPLFCGVGDPAAPSPKVLWGYVEHLLGLRKENSERRLALETIWHWDGMVKNDATFNFCKHIRESKSGEVFKQLENILTGSGIVLNSCGVPGKDAMYLTKLLTHVAERAEKGDNLGVDVAAADMCCEIATTWHESLGRIANVRKRAEGAEGDAEESRFLSFVDYNHSPTTEVLTTSAQVNAVVGHIYSELGKRGDEDKVIGFDIENTPKTVPGAKPPYGRTDTIQLALAAHGEQKGQSWVIHCRGWAEKDKPLPKQLHKLLEDPTVTKVGVCVSRDATMLGKADSFPSTAVAPIEDCGKLAKAAAITPNARPKLSTLAATLQPEPENGSPLKTLDKGPQVSNWSNPNNVTDSQIKYAAMDAVVSVETHRVLKRLLRDSVSTPGIGDEVLVLDRTCNSRVAIGIVVKTCQSTVTVDVSDTLVGGYKPPGKHNGGHYPGGKRTKGAKMVQFTLAQLKANWVKSPQNIDPGSGKYRITVTKRQVRNKLPEHGRFEEVLANDSASLTVADWTEIWLKLDIFHAQQRIKPLSKKHGAFKRFAAAFRDAVFAVSPEAAETVKQKLMTNRGITWEEADQLYITDNQYFIDKVERHVPEPEALVEALEMVRAIFADCEDADTGKKFFTPDTHLAFDRVVSHARKGCLSDRPGVSYYYRATDRNGNEGPLRSRRGTSQIEALHYHLRRLLHGAHNVSQVKAVLLLAEYISRWNSRQAARSHSEPWYTWYDFGKMEAIVELAAQCGVVEYPHLRLTSEYEVDPEHIRHLYAWPAELDTDVDESAPGLVDDTDSEEDEDEADAELAEEQRERARLHRDQLHQTHENRLQQAQDTARHIAGSSDKPGTRAESSKMGADTNAAGPSKSQVPVNGDELLVTSGNLSMYEWRLLRTFDSRGLVAPTVSKADQYVTRWNGHSDAMAALGKADGCHYQLRKINKQIAVDLYTLQKDTSNARDTLRSAFDQLKEFDAKMAERNAQMAERSDGAAFEDTETRVAQPRAEHPNKPIEARMPPSSIVDRAHRAVPEGKERKRLPRRCGNCKHIYQGVSAKTVGMDVYHPSGKCLLEGNEKHCAVAARSRQHKLDPSINAGDADPSVFHQSWVHSQWGCQYCMNGLRHPFPDPDGLV